MAEKSYSLERHDTTGELYLVEWTDGIDAPTGLCGPVSEETLRSTPPESLVERGTFAVGAWTGTPRSPGLRWPSSGGEEQAGTPEGNVNARHSKACMLRVLLDEAALCYTPLISGG
jgi:hypothetical protein